MPVAVKQHTAHHHASTARVPLTTLPSLLPFLGVECLHQEHCVRPASHTTWRSMHHDSISIRITWRHARHPPLTYTTRTSRLCFLHWHIYMTSCRIRTLFQIRNHGLGGGPVRNSGSYCPISIGARGKGFPPSYISLILPMSHTLPLPTRPCVRPQVRFLVWMHDTHMYREAFAEVVGHGPSHRVIRGPIHFGALPASPQPLVPPPPPTRPQRLAHVLANVLAGGLATQNSGDALASTAGSNNADSFQFLHSNIAGWPVLAALPPDLPPAPHARGGRPAVIYKLDRGLPLPTLPLPVAVRHVPDAAVAEGLQLLLPGSAVQALWPAATAAACDQQSPHTAAEGTRHDVELWVASPAAASPDAAPSNTTVPIVGCLAPCKEGPEGSWALTVRDVCAMEQLRLALERYPGGTPVLTWQRDTQRGGGHVWAGCLPPAPERPPGSLGPEEWMEARQSAMLLRQREAALRGRARLKAAGGRAMEQMPLKMQQDDAEEGEEDEEEKEEENQEADSDQQQQQQQQVASLVTHGLAAAARDQTPLAVGVAEGSSRGAGRGPGQEVALPAGREHTVTGSEDHQRYGTASGGGSGGGAEGGNSGGSGGGGRSGARAASGRAEQHEVQGCGKGAAGTRDLLLHAAEAASKALAHAFGLVDRLVEEQGRRGGSTGSGSGAGEEVQGEEGCSQAVQADARAAVDREVGGRLWQRLAAANAKKRAGKSRE